MSFRNQFLGTIALLIIFALTVGLAGSSAIVQAGVKAATANAQAALGTSIPYQGQLNDNGNPANGAYDFQFKLFDDASAGNPIGSEVNQEDVAVANGLFAVALDFGSSAFNGEARYLEIGVRPGASTGVYTTLSPRRPLLASPYALYSNATRGLSVDANGNVGIGTTTPAAKLQVVGSFGANGPVDINFSNLLGASPESATFSFLGQTMGRHSLGWFRPAGNQDTEMWLSGDKAIRFFTRADNATDPKQVLAITRIGNFDIEVGTRLGPSADSGFEFYHRDQYMTGNAISWVQPPGSTRGEMWLSGNNGMTFFTAQTPRMGVAANGDVGIYGSLGVDSGLFVKGGTTTDVLRITGGDLAEPFAIADADSIEPGMVVAIDPDNPGQMRLSTAAYDRTVAGVVSGAGGIEPGVLMYKDGASEDTHPVALSGRVYVYADTTNGPIVPGDLLTTSDTPGHAMKVTEHERAQGAILGKAMSRLEEGTGLVLVLVTLQ